MLLIRAAAIAAALLSAAPAASAERTTTTAKSAYACTSWAGWREYGQASLTAAGARMSKNCPLRIPAGAKVEVVEEDAGEGASQVRYRGKNWFVDAQRLR